MDLNKHKVAADSLKKVTTYTECGNYGRAFSHYLVYFELLPEMKAENETSFTSLLYLWGAQLAYQNRFEDFCKCYIQAITYFPRSSAILNNFGAHLLRLGEPLAGKRYLELAAVLDPDYLPAEKNLMAAKLMLLPRWHFQMLNDRQRNFGYYKALLKTISDTHNEVIDIGSGSGLLSLYSNSMPKTKRVTAIEGSKVLYEICKDVFNAYRTYDIKLIHSNSTELTSQVSGSVVVTEIFDTAFFGEYVLTTMVHAWEHFLKPDAKVIPNRAVVYVAGIKSGVLYRNFKVLKDIPEIGLSKLCVTLSTDDTYESENLSDAEGMEIITDIKELCEVNFSNPIQMERLLCETNHFDVINLECQLNREVDAFAVWFDLILSKDNILTTNPFDKNLRCWDQAVFYLKHPMKVLRHQKLKVKPSLPEEQLHLELLDVETKCEQCYKVSKRSLKFLNDVAFVRKVKQLAEKMKSRSDLVVLDTNVFPLFGLLLAKHAKRVYASVHVRDMELVKRLMKENGLDDSKFCITVKGTLHEFRDVKDVNVVFTNPVDSDGTLSELSGGLNINGLMLPYRTNLMFQIISSDEMLNMNRIDDSALCGFELAAHFEDYVVLEQGDMSRDTPYVPLSNPVSIQNIVHSEKTVKASFDVEITANGVAHGILVWYRIDWLEDDDGADKFETINFPYFNLACFLLRQPREVERNDTIKINFKQLEWFIDLYDCSAY